MVLFMIISPISGVLASWPIWRQSQAEIQPTTLPA